MPSVKAIIIVRLNNLAMPFGAVAKSDTDISALLSQNLGVAGRADATVVTAFTDGCPGLRTILVNAGIPTPPILDWFHLAMRFQHATQAASGLSADNARRVQAKAVIVDEVERLRGAFGMARPRTPRAASTGSAKSCMSTSENPAIRPKVRHRGGYGTRCTILTSICEVRAAGSSTTPGGTVQVFVLGLRSLRAQPSPHIDAAIAFGKSPALATASANFSMSGMSRCSGMFGIRS